VLNLNLSTILFQIVNFFILLAILRYFVYTPLLRVMRQREAEIAARMRDADERAKKADAEREALAAERAQARVDSERLLADARTEAAATSAKILDAAREEAAQQLASAGQSVAEQERTALENLASQIADSAVAFAGSLIRASAGPAVHQALLEKLTSDRLGLSPDQIAAIRADLRDGQVRVELAYPPTPDDERSLAKAIERSLDLEVHEGQVSFAVSPDLIAGARITIGTLAIDLSLANTLVQLKDTARSSAEPARSEPIP
jgi:F-type H+-transporting ATPase subunit b